jgi:hypothetical protein
MNIQTIHEFVAHGEITRGNVSVPVTIVGKYPSHGAGKVECKVVTGAANWPQEFEGLFDFQNPIALRGKTEAGHDIWSPELRLTSATRGFINIPSSGDLISIEGNVPFFIEGDLSNFDPSIGRFSCVVSLTPTPLALLTPGYYLSYPDGTIARRGKLGKKRKGIRWYTKFGQAELIDNYNYIDDKVGFDPASIQIQKCQITIQIRIHRRTTSLKNVFTELENILEEPLLLLSFLSRRNVSWYEARATFFSKDHSQPHRDAIVRHQQDLAYDGDIDVTASRFNVPINPQILSEGLFQTLLTTYRQSPLKNTIRQTIQYLLVTNESGYFEANLGLTYAALESLIDGLSKHHRISYLMGSSKFDKLTKKLEQVIRTEISDPDIAKSVVDKLPELRRPPIRERLLNLLEIYRLNKVRMNSDINTTVQKVLTRRNTFIHSGFVDYDKHFEDFLLLKELIELWILTLLDCPDKAINTSAFRKVALTR